MLTITNIALLQTLYDRLIATYVVNTAKIFPLILTKILQP